jgi:hypothetical protein
MPPTRHDAEWQAPTGHTYQELGHRDRIDRHYHDVRQIVYPSSGVLAISAAAATWVVPPHTARQRATMEQVALDQLDPGACRLRARGSRRGSRG